jgi:glutamate racemase
MVRGSIGIFDSGLGGLSVFRSIARELPDYDYIYLGDNARVPYGNRSFDTVYRFTWECVLALFKLNCPLVIIACNTASAKALRSIQQNDLSSGDYRDRKVLGVLRPTTEIIGHYTRSRRIGIMGTVGTVASRSYEIEITKFFPDIHVYQQACPLLVPLIENNVHHTDGGRFFIKKYVDEMLLQCAEIDTVVLACTHYPLIASEMDNYLPTSVCLLSQGDIVARSLKDYLQRHTEIEKRITTNQSRLFYTTDDPVEFDDKSAPFWGSGVSSSRIVVSV